MLKFLSVLQAVEYVSDHYDDLDDSDVLHIGDGNMTVAEFKSIWS